jgi:cation:H+ antiporter
VNPWLTFVISGAVVVLAGIALSRYGDAIAERTGLGGAWVGAILVAAATSLPELTTDIYAVRQGNPSLAIGGLFGACMANMAILSIADLTVRRHRILTRIAINQALVGVLAMTLIATAAAGALTGTDLSLGPVSWATLGVAFGYVTGMRVLHLNRPEPPFSTKAEAEAAALRAPSLQRAVTGFSLAAIAIFVAARPLASSSAAIAERLGVTTGVVGVALLALMTTLPELTVTLASVRLGAYDLAVGNMLGSNCFNMLILFLLDLADGRSLLLYQAGLDVLIGAMFAVLLTGQATLEVLNKSERRSWLLEPDATLRLATYALGLYLVVQAGGG